MTAAPILSRRHAAGAAGARGLLFTLLGEFALPSGGAAWTSAVIDVLGRVGIEEKAARQALMRTAADGWLTGERVGRRTCWRLTPAAQRLLVDGTERIYSFTAAATDWDGRWLVALVRTPETERATRHLVRTRLSRVGLGSPAPGVWVGTHAERLPEVDAVLREVGALDDAQVFIAQRHGLGDVQALVRQAWDLDSIERGYEDFVAQFGGRRERDPLAATVSLVHMWRRFPWTDPLLPTSLLPAPWMGVAAARLFARLHARWAADARTAWAALNTEAG